MQVIPPITITDAMLNSSSLFETVPAAYNAGTTYGDGDNASVAGSANSYTVYESLQAANTGNTPASSPAWWLSRGTVYGAYAGGTTYALGDYAQDNTDHLLYISLQASNTGHTPATSPTWWELVGPTNTWAMFDYSRNTQSTQPSTMTVVIEPGERTNSLALSGLTANSYTLTVTSATYGGTIYSSSGSLNTRNTLSWYDYFFEPITTKESLAFFDIPPYTDSIYTITLTATSGNVSCGACVLGIYIYLGETMYNAVSDVMNFSSITRDADTGEAVLTARRNIPKTQQTVYCEKARVNKVRQARDDLNATPAFWYGLNDDDDEYFESLSILGIYKQFSINIDHEEVALISLELEEI